MARRYELLFSSGKTIFYVRSFVKYCFCHEKIKFIFSSRRVIFHLLYTAISRKVVGIKVHATIPKGNMGYDQYAVPYTVAVEPSIVAFL